jgi:hypothetical protein
MMPRSSFPAATPSPGLRRSPRECRAPHPRVPAANAANQLRQKVEHRASDDRETDSPLFTARNAADEVGGIDGLFEQGVRARDERRAGRRQRHTAAARLGCDPRDAAELPARWRLDSMASAGRESNAACDTPNEEELMPEPVQARVGRSPGSASTPRVAARLGRLLELRLVVDRTTDSGRPVSIHPLRTKEPR